MHSRTATCPMTRHQLIEEYFLENRARLLDLAGFLDRLDRAGPPDATSDPRLDLLNQALEVLSTRVPERVEMIQMIFSDLTLIPDADG